MDDVARRGDDRPLAQQGMPHRVWLRVEHGGRSGWVPREDHREHPPAGHRFQTVEQGGFAGPPAQFRSMVARHRASGGSVATMAGRHGDARRITLRGENPTNGLRGRHFAETRACGKVECPAKWVAVKHRCRNRACVRPSEWWRTFSPRRRGVPSPSESWAHSTGRERFSEGFRRSKP